MKDVRDRIIAETARVIRELWDGKGDGGTVFEMSAALNSYDDTLGPEDVLAILASLPRKREESEPEKDGDDKDDDPETDPLERTNVDDL
jgi:hypothetical protein